MVNLLQYLVRFATAIWFLVIDVKKNKHGMKRINTITNTIKNHNRQLILKIYPIHFIEDKDKKPIFTT